MGARPQHLSFVPAWAALAAAVACYPTAGTEPHTADVSGLWMFTESFNDVAHAISCSDTGTYRIMQSGTTFTGVYAQRGVCQTPTGKVDNADSGFVREGKLTGHTLRFAAPNCAYDGSVNADTFDRIDGHVACELRDSTRIYTFSGSWKATR